MNKAFDVAGFRQVSLESAGRHETVLYWFARVHINVRVRLANQCSRSECCATRSLYLDTRVLIKYATTYRVYEVTAQREVENRYFR